jgi:hypothetical protein
MFKRYYLVERARHKPPDIVACRLTRHVGGYVLARLVDLAREPSFACKVSASQHKLGVGDTRKDATHACLPDDVRGQRVG